MHLAQMECLQIYMGQNEPLLSSYILPEVQCLGAVSQECLPCLATALWNGWPLECQVKTLGQQQCRHDHYLEIHAQKSPGRKECS